MNLQKNQIHALTSEVISRKENDLRNEKKKYRSDRRVIAQARRFAAIHREVPKKVSRHVYGHKDLTLLSTWLKALTDSKTFKTNVPAWNEVENSILVMSIDAKDFDHLKKRIAAKYK